MITYRDVIKLPSFDERLNLLILEDYEYDSPRSMMMKFYKSLGWKQLRIEIIKRDLGQDLGVDGLYINGKILVHHIQPVTYSDIINNHKMLLNPDNLITVSVDTHNIIHYGKPAMIIERTPNDTILW